MSSQEEQKYQRSFDDKNTIDDLILLENPTNESITEILGNRFDKNWIYVCMNKFYFYIS
jgi:hypothetical protein